MLSVELAETIKGEKQKIPNIKTKKIFKKEIFIFILYPQLKNTTKLLIHRTLNFKIF